MIDFSNVQTYKLEDVADYERAKANKIYPAGTSTLQISATKGQIGYLTEAKTIPSKDVAIIPSAGINPEYFNFALQRNIDLFMHKYATGLNIKEEEVGKFPIDLPNQDTQKMVVLLDKMNQLQAKQTQEDIDNLNEFKHTMLDYLFI